MAADRRAMRDRTIHEGLRRHAGTRVRLLARRPERAAPRAHGP
jgi:hypothetical protein